jgi:hypothetical protein
VLQDRLQHRVLLHELAGYLLALRAAAEVGAGSLADLAADLTADLAADLAAELRAAEAAAEGSLRLELLLLAVPWLLKSSHV